MARFRFHPDPAALRFDCLPAERKAQPATRILSPVQPPERLKNPLVVCRIYSRTVVLYNEQPVRAVPSRGNVNPRFRLVAISSRVIEKVPRYFYQLSEIACHHGQRIESNNRGRLSRTRRGFN